MIDALLWLSKTYSDIARHGTCSFQWYGRKLWQKSFWLSYFRFLVPIWLVRLFRSNLKPWHWVLESSTILTLCHDLFFQQTWKVCAFIGTCRISFFSEVGHDEGSSCDCRIGWSYEERSFWRNLYWHHMMCCQPSTTWTCLAVMFWNSPWFRSCSPINFSQKIGLFSDSTWLLYTTHTLANVSRRRTARTLPQVGEPLFCTL